jgi:hypothetical protein
MKPSLCLPTLQVLQHQRLRELFVLDRLRRERQLIRRLKADTMASIAGLDRKIAWEVKQLKAET